MISVKTGTKTFSDSKQVSGLRSGNGPNTISAADQKKYFGDKELGDVLNQVADPNWIDPSKKARSVGNNQLDKDAFMKLLLVQMKNQDPTNPLKSHEMAAQLAQFSSLEQLQNINTSIGELSEKQAPEANFDALRMIGQKVSGDSAKLFKTDSDQPLAIRFNLASTANTADIVIKDLNGNVMRELKAFELEQGDNEISWDGKMNNGAAAREGDYRVEIKAVGSNGSRIHAETKFDGKVTGVNFTSSGPVLMMGNKAVKMKDIQQIIDSNIKSEDDAKEVNQGKVKDAEKKTEITAAAQGQGDLSDIAMDRGMLDKAKKSGVNTGAM